MEMRLSENIKKYRKERKMTQEQLAEVLGVTVGAVYKWEAGICFPELRLIMKLAEYFDTSVDVLIGYEMTDNGLKAIKERLKKYIGSADEAGIEEADKALAKYPNNFDIVYLGALIYHIVGVALYKKEYTKKAYELFEKSLLLIDQNTEPSVSDMSIYNQMAQTKIILGRYKEGIELLKKHNKEGVFNDIIGYSLSAYLKQYDEAKNYLSWTMIQSYRNTTEIVFGYVFIYCAKGEYGKAEDVLNWGINLLESLKTTDKMGILDKYLSVTLAILAYVYMKSGDKKKALATYKKALKTAEQFDENPDYNAGNLKFVEAEGPLIIRDILGQKAVESMDKALELFDDSDTVSRLKGLK